MNTRHFIKEQRHQLAFLELRAREIGQHAETLPYFLFVVLAAVWRAEHQRRSS